jgi:lysylphosphatidylglycerol synthetase-like protein (DUF2156 family)
LALAVVLWWHPAGGENVYEGVRDDVDAWLFVHTAFLLATPLLGIAAFLLLRGLSSRAATVSRLALIGSAAVFAIHPPPTGSLGLVCFATALVLLERARARNATTPVSPPRAAAD